MTVIIDTTLSEHVNFMAAFTPRMQEMGVGYCLCAHPEPGSVRWVRKVTERAVDDHAQVSSSREDSASIPSSCSSAHTFHRVCIN